MPPPAVSDPPEQDAVAPWHTLEITGVAEGLQTSLEHGLSASEAARRLQESGPNKLPEAPPLSPWTLLAGQFRSAVVLVLLAAAAVSGLLGEWVDATAIGAIIVLNAVLGFVQEFRAEQSLAALRTLDVPHARVVRDGLPRVVDAVDVVAGDLVLVEAGDRVPADARVVYAAALRSSEASLTGESVPVTKREAPLASVDVPIADRSNMLFFGTEVASGKGRGVVVATGPRTELGRIATLIGTAGHESTPLERRLGQLAGVLLVLSLGIVAVVFLVGLLRGEPLFSMFLTSVSLAVAAVPEGLPAMVTIALALGVTRMARRNALVRRLAAVETLGSTTIICTDKTGTLTRGQMRVRAFHTPGSGAVVENATQSAVVKAVLESAVLCSDARLVEERHTWRVVGDPTEGAFLLAAAEAGIFKEALESHQPIVFEVPFDPERKRMTVVRRKGPTLAIYVKGAMDTVVPRCVAVMRDDGASGAIDREAVSLANDAFAREALRVLAVATRSLDALPDPPEPEALERDLTLLGLAALEDPLRPEAADAVRACRDAGIRVVMITGDHRATAAAIAGSLGLLDSGGVLTGSDLDRFDEAALREHVRTTAVYARVTAEHKLRIVRAWKAHGAVVAMTGDGVNDAPALKAADVGIAMGITGTDVAKDASDMVVTDDNFASIVAAVEEGRGIYANIQRGLQYLLSCNLSEILLMLLATLVALPLPLLPVQILWTNLVTDGLPALALAVERGDPDAMHRPPRPPDARFVDARRLTTIARHGFLMAAAPLIAYAWFLRGGADLDHARGLAFSALVFSQLAHALNSRHERRSLFSLGLFTNPLLLLACGSAAAIQVGIMTIPAVQPVFGVASLMGPEWLVAVLLGLMPIAGMEFEKLLWRSRDKQGAG